MLRSEKISNHDSQIVVFKYENTEFLIMFQKNQPNRLDLIERCLIGQDWL